MTLLDSCLDFTKREPKILHIVFAGGAVLGNVQFSHGASSIMTHIYIMFAKTPSIGMYSENQFVKNGQLVESHNSIHFIASKFQF